MLLVHDVVPEFLDDESVHAQVLPNIRTLLAVAHETRLPVVFVAPARPGPGTEVPASLGVLRTDTIVRKPRWGAFFGTGLDDELRAAGHDTIVICGISLAGGVETTVRDAFNRDFHSIVVADACLARPVPDQGWGAVTREEVARVTLSILAQRFARVVTTAQLCAELRG